MRTLTTVLLLGLLALLAASCATSQSRFSRLTDSYPAKPETFRVEVFASGLPQRPFERIARLDVHLEKTHFLPSSLKEAMPALEKQARLSGADAIIEIQEKRWTVNETKVYHVTATAVRYTDTP
jgi:hypothetical protein